MLTARKPFLKKSAADLMTGNVVVIPQTMTLKEAAHRLAQARVTGAPVVDGHGRCVGVLSATDFIAWADKGAEAAKRSSWYAACAQYRWPLADLNELPVDEVWRHMTADPVMATPRTHIGDLAGMMLDADIHRVIIVDENQRPVGVVSATDILAAVAEAARRISVQQT